ncbi:MAG: MobA/MobL family protein [Chloroflexi bacterium]|nr:MobA/MobL family protein [Chloroflexota bacterium]
MSENVTVEKKENRWEITNGKTRYTVREEMTGKSKDKPQLLIYSQSVQDYSRKGGVLFSEILAPDGSPEWVKNRSDLWTAHEAAAKRSDAQVAQEVRVALPRELDLEQNKNLLRDFVGKNFTRRGMVADVAIHETDASDGDKNPHGHILLTMREIESNGFGNINREWNDGRGGMRKQQLNTMRESWAIHTNRSLADAEKSERVSHRSHKERGINRVPTIHLGKEATAMERKGLPTRFGLENQAREHYNDLKNHIREQGIEPQQRSQEMARDINRLAREASIYQQLRAVPIDRSTEIEYE